MLGRMDEEGYKQKGFDVLLKALPLIKDDMVVDDAEMVIIGEGSKYSNFKLLVEQYGFVTLKPNLPHQHLLALLQQSHVVLLPSLYEGVSMFALEGRSGIYSHVSFRKDKSDCHRQKELIEIISILI